MKKAYIISVLMIVIAVFLFVSCGQNNQPNSNSIVISAKLGSGYHVAASGIKANSLDVSVSAVCAIPFNTANVWTMKDFIKLQQVATVQSDGSFSITLNKAVSENWVLLLLDTSVSSKIDQVKGYVAVKVDDQYNVIQFPLGSVSENINLGTLEVSSQNTDEATTTSAEAGCFNLTTSKLQQIAKTDQTLKGLKNMYANYDLSNDHYFIVSPVFLWNSGSMATIDNQFPNPELLFQASTPVYYMYMKNNTGAFTAEDVNNHVSNVTLTPPSPINIASVDFSTVEVYNVSLLTDESHSASNESTGVIQDGWQYFKGDIPTGIWNEKAGETSICLFDLGVSYAPDSHSYPQIYIPVIKVTTNDSHIVTQIDFKWYMNNNGAFEEVTDLATLNAVMGDQVMLWLNGDFTNDEYHYFDATTTSITSFDRSWTFPKSLSGDNVVNMIAINYDCNFINYRFMWNLE